MEKGFAVGLDPDIAPFAWLRTIGEAEAGIEAQEISCASGDGFALEKVADRVAIQTCEIPVHGARQVLADHHSALRSLLTLHHPKNQIRLSSRGSYRLY